MTLDLPLRTVVDNSDELRVIRPRTGGGRRRDLHLLFAEADTGGYHVRGWGDALHEDGGGAYAGRLELSRMDVFALVDEVREVWNNTFLGYQKPSETGYPFNDRVDLTDPRLAADLDVTIRELARAGHKLFRALFYSGDQGLREIGDSVAAALRAARLVISVHSENLFAPWSMLYIPPPGVNLSRADAVWDPEGFVGFRHLVEHNFKRTSPSWDPCIKVSGRVRAGLSVDRNLDAQFPDTPTVGPVVKVFEEHSQVTIREDRQRLAEDITSDSFDEQFLYFGCHAVVGGTDRADEQAYLILTDRKPIYSSDFRYWLQERPLHSNPMVFVNACRGGQMSSQFYTSFARILMQYGANCLLGPQIDIPPAFAAAYACEFVAAVLTGERRAGDVVRDLARDFLVRQGNPLGLTMSLYRGLDSYFA